MFDSTESIDLVANYIEALGLASGARARRRALQLLNDARATCPEGDVDPSSLLRTVREQVILADSLIERSLPPETPAKMPPQSFRYGGRRSSVRDQSSQTGWAAAPNPAAVAEGR